VATGENELTFNVNILRNARTPRLEIHFKEAGRAPELAAAATPQALAELAVRRRDADQAFLAGIDHLVFGYPNPYLSAFDLIDTPGLDSVFSDESRNALRALGLEPDQVRAASLEHATLADALVHVFSGHGRAASETELVRDFEHAATMSTSPITAIGALTKIEHYWRPDRSDVMAVGQHVASKLMSDGGASAQLYELRPVASLVGAAAGGLTEADFADLRALALDIEPTVLVSRVRFGPGFTSAEFPELPVPPGRRRSLFERLAACGIMLASQLIRAEGVADLATLRRELDERSGLTAFRALLAEHFGRRADLIKLQRLLAQVSELPRELAARPEVTARDRAAVDDLAAACAGLERNVLPLAELTVIRACYDQRLEFTPADAADALRLLGEHGGSAAARLGRPAGTPVAELAARARERRRYWQQEEATGAYSGPTRRAAQVVLRRCVELEREAGRTGPA
jgi:hypothetical protein